MYETHPGWIERRVMSMALILYCLAIFVFAVFPTSTLNWVEVVVAAFAVLAIIGLVADLVARIRLPAESFAYLVTSFVGLTTLIGYELRTADPLYVRWRIGLVLGVGVVAGYGAHLSRRTQ